MENHIYKKIEITGTSDQSIEAAIENAVARASQTVDGNEVVRSHRNPRQYRR
jgi:flavin-binding protein dodecin